jgi:hypothetical protein
VLIVNTSTVVDKVFIDYHKIVILSVLHMLLLNQVKLIKSGELGMRNEILLIAAIFVS